mmetsp:Transcript_19029/g.48815  ORF Transcript_19029/g.48815 Transcript_19029/m.48815 type:complete len:310 (+) Transcript_19029:456-1385(+)
MEDEGHWLVALAAELLLDVLLRVVQDLRLQLHVARGIHTVHVAEGSRNSEVAIGHGRKGLVHLPHLLRLRVQAARVHVRVVNAVLLAARDAQLHLEQQVDLGHALQVLLADGNVILQGLLGEVQHVRGEERLAVLLEVLLVGLHQAIEPRQPRLLAVVRVQDHRHTVELRHGTHVQRTRDSAGNAGLVVTVVRGLASDELAAALGEGHHDGAAGLLRSLHARVDGAGAHDVHARDCEALLLGIAEQVHKRLASHDASLHGGRQVLEASLLRHRRRTARHLGALRRALAGLRRARRKGRRAERTRTHIHS